MNLSKKEQIKQALRKGWWTNYELVVKYGPSALARVREIRLYDGCNVKKERLKTMDGKASNTWRYRI